MKTRYIPVWNAVIFTNYSLSLPNLRELIGSNKGQD